MPLNESEERSSSPKSATCEPISEVDENPSRKLYTVKQFSLLYGLAKESVIARIHSGQLQAIRHPSPGKTAKFYIVDPGWNSEVSLTGKKLRDGSLVDDVHTLNGTEVALLLGVTPRGVRMMVQRGQLKCVRTGLYGKSHRRYSVADVRRIMTMREKRSYQKRRPGRKAIRKHILTWAMRQLGIDKLPKADINSLK
jgi:hypothetical protein